MNPPMLNPVLVPGQEDESAAPELRSVVRKSALLNVVIVLISCPVLVLAGGLKALVPTLEIMAGTSVLIWTATFALFSFVSLARLFSRPVSTGKLGDPPHPEKEKGVADRWMDGPL